MGIKTSDRWYSGRVGQEVTLVRWGHWGQLVLLFPTPGATPRRSTAWASSGRSGH